MRRLYVTDGVYGSLSDAGAPGFCFARLLRPDGPSASATTRDYVLFGPTCDSADRVAGPFPLSPMLLKATGSRLVSSAPTAPACAPAGFNGFDVTSAFEVRDPPMLS